MALTGEILEIINEGKSNINRQMQTVPRFMPTI